MSQFYIQGTGSSPPAPSVNQLTPDQGGAVTPVANNINLFSQTSTLNFNNGIRTINGGAGELDVRLTNRLTGQVTTNDATPTTIVTFPLGTTPGVYNLTGQVTAYDLTDIAGATYYISIGIRTSGVAGIFIGAKILSSDREPSLTTSDISLSSSGNNLVIQVVGIAATTIDWDILLNYRFVS